MSDPLSDRSLPSTFPTAGRSDPPYRLSITLDMREERVGETSGLSISLERHGRGHVGTISTLVKGDVSV